MITTLVKKVLPMVERCEADVPNRCQARTGKGQCPAKAMAGVKYCEMHGGVTLTRVKAEASQSNYKLAKWQERLKEKRDSPAIKSLRDEAGILRMTLEALIEKCTDDADLIMYSHQISELVLKIEKLVTSCHKLEDQLGQVLDKQQLMNFADGVVRIISEHVPADKLAQISDLIAGLLEQQQNDMEASKEG